ncbi:MAG: DUF1223 domain-containing protein [Alphaproteobacteria bacterium]|nr:DUF1223 domain-containing protein [Alphaproteobacteria bacterium]
MKTLIALVAVAGLAAPALAAERLNPVVVELFTSQGCNSCPPADIYLGELAKRRDVLALSWHVDYWDYIGWKDPFAQPAFTARQRNYQRALMQRYVYTPQMVIDGRLQGVGSERSTIDGLIAQAARQRDVNTASRPSLRLDGDVVKVEGGKVETAAVVWLAVFEPEHRTAVRRNENAGRSLGNYNVVRELRVLGRYTGEAVALPLGLNAAMAGKGCAIVVQSELASGPGAVLASLVVDPAR